MTTPIVDLPSALSHLRLSQDTITEEEGLDVERMVEAATEWSEQYCRRKWVTTPLLAQFTRFPTARDQGMLIPHGATSITAIKYYDTDEVQQTWDAANYRLINTNVRSYVYTAIGVDWPTDCGEEFWNIEVTYDAGTILSDVPTAAQAAVLLMVGSMYEYREEGVIDNAGLALVEAPVAAKRLLTPLKLSH